MVQVLHANYETINISCANKKKEAGILNEDHALDHHEQQLKRRRRVDLDGGHNGGNEL